MADISITFNCLSEEQAAHLTEVFRCMREAENNRDVLPAPVSTAPAQADKPARKPRKTKAQKEAEAAAAAEAKAAETQAAAERFVAEADAAQVPDVSDDEMFENLLGGPTTAPVPDMTDADYKAKLVKFMSTNGKGGLTGPRITEFFSAEYGVARPADLPHKDRHEAIAKLDQLAQQQ